jgi:hypothetical protein
LPSKPLPPRYTTLIDARFPRALPYVLYNHVLNATQLTRLVVQGKKALFPNGYPAESPPDPTPEEQILLRERLEARLSAVLPCRHLPWLPVFVLTHYALAIPASLLLGHDAATRGKTISNVIAPLSSTECNVHLLILLFDAVLLAVFPEMGVVSGGNADYTEEDMDDPLLIGYPSVETLS